MDIVAKLLDKTEVMKFNSNKKTVEVVMSIRKETYEIICNNITRHGKQTCESKVNIMEIKEIRIGKGSKDFELCSTEAKKFDENKCFVIYYGNEFNLKTLSVGTYDFDDTCNWKKGINLLLKEYIPPYQMKLDIWIRKLFENLCQNGVLTVKQGTQYNQKISLKITIARFQELLEKYGDINGSGIEFYGFSALTKDLLYNRNPNMQIFTDCFGQYASNSEQISTAGFLEFLKHEQSENENELDVMSNYKEFFITPASNKTSNECYMSVDKAIDFLFSKENQVWNTFFDQVYQDMKQPLSHYWIASSHNTYLTGDQISSESSVESYTRCLKMGCRCIELDCFDGPDNLPVIYHQLTLVTKIPFVDVLISIKENAFKTSEYPIVLSIENHCSVEQQKVMALKFKEIFGDMLVTKQLKDNETHLPSPDQLKRRIILKGKVISSVEYANSGDDSSSETESNTFDQVIKTGRMFIQNQSSVWEPYFFALKQDKLSFIEIEKNKDDLDKPESSSVDELHLNKKWFHGDVPGGTKEAEKRVKAFGQEGCFLVRNSSSVEGEFSICFLSEGEACHIRIPSKYDNKGQRLFYLDPATTFDSLYTLINYYRRNAYENETKKFRIERFTKAVPPPDVKEHENEQWFYKDIDRTAAENVLAKIPITGAFLVRYAQQDSRFAISFRYEQMIKHCRILEDGKFYSVSNRQFESIISLVNYYQKHNFYKGVKLEQPVTKDMYRTSLSLQNSGTIYTHAGYYDSSNASITVRAILDYAADDPDKELVFQKDDVITNVHKQGGGWWKGDLGENQKQKWFPREFVEEIEVLESPFGVLQSGSVDLGKVEITKNLPGNDECPFILNIWGSPVPFRVGVSSRKEAEEWQKEIDRILCRNSFKLFGGRKKKKSPKKSKIAKELSKLIIYACSVPKVNSEKIRQIGRAFHLLFSLEETKADKFISSEAPLLVWLHQVQIGRVYPQGKRFDSSNFNPVRYWNHGCQMAALNYQTADRSMSLNQGRFKQNGNCGYVLKPNCLLQLQENFDPNDKGCLEAKGIIGILLKLTVIAGRLILKHDTTSHKQVKGIVCPFVEIEIIGAAFDNRKVQTLAVEENGLNPYWKQKFEFEILNPELALIRFVVHHEDTFGDSMFLSQACYPVRCLREGYRSVPLLNGYGEELLSSILIHVAIIEKKS